MPTTKQATSIKLATTVRHFLCVWPWHCKRLYGLTIFFQCFRVFIPLSVRLTLLQQMDMGSLTCAQIWVRAVHTRTGVRHKQTCTRVDSEGQRTCPPPCPAIQYMYIMATASYNELLIRYNYRKKNLGKYLYSSQRNIHWYFILQRFPVKQKSLKLNTKKIHVCQRQPNDVIQSSEKFSCVFWIAAVRFNPQCSMAWRVGSVARALDRRSKGRGFKSRQEH